MNASTWLLTVGSFKLYYDCDRYLTTQQMFDANSHQLPNLQCHGVQYQLDCERRGLGWRWHDYIP